MISRYDILSKINNPVVRETLGLFHVLVLCSMLLGAFFIFDSEIHYLFQYTWIAIIVVVFFLPNIVTTTRYIKGSLNKKIEEEKEAMCGDKLKKKYFDLKTLYNPSVPSVIAISLFGIIINAPAFLQSWGGVGVDTSGKADFFNNFIAVHAGIGAIIFALLIFVAESLRDDSKEQASVLLRESLLFPLTLLEIITLLFLLGFNFQNALVVIPIIIVGLLTMYSLYKLIRILLSPYAFKEKRLNLLKDRVRTSIDQALCERIGNNILHKFLDKEDSPVTAWHFSRRDKKSNVPFKLNKHGIVQDVNLDVLKELGDLVEGQANSLGLSLFANKAKMSASSGTANAQETTETEYYAELKKWDATLTKFYRERVEPEYDVVFSLSKQIVNNDIIFQARVQGLVEQLFDIGKKDNFSDEIKLELEALRDQFIDAIQQLKISQIDYLKGVYLSLVEVFLELVNQCGGGYTPEQAKKEFSATAFKEGWPEIEWLDSHIRDVFRASIQTENKEIVRKIAFLPLSIAIKGIQSNDHFIFQKFIRYAGFLYWEALEVEDNQSLKDDMIDHSVTWLRELSEFHIELEMEEHPEKVEFAVQILIELQGILKESYDKSDIGTFRKVVEVIAVLLNRFESRHHRHPTSEHLQWGHDQATDPAIKAEIGLRIQELKKQEEADKNFEDSRAHLFFGFTSWMFRSIRKSTATIEENKPFFEAIRSKLPNDLGQLTEVFDQCTNHDIQHKFGWDWWDVIPNGGVQTINYGSALEDLYLFLALELLTRKTPEEIDAINITPSRDLAFAAEPNSSIRRKLDDLNSIDNFDKFISEPARQKVEAMKSLLEKTKTAQEAKEKIEIRERALSETKVQEFWDLFKKEYYEHATARALFKMNGKLVDKSGESTTDPADVDLMGYNQIDTKEGFFEGWYVHYVGWGEQYGEGLARSEDSSIYKKLTDNLVEKRKISFTALIPTLEEILETKKYENPCLLSPFAYSLEMRNLRSSEKFIPQWNNQRNHKGYDKLSFYMGFIDTKYAQVPVFSIRDSGEQRDACLIDMSKIGTFMQYPPIKNIAEKQHQKEGNIFSFNVIDLNSNDEARNKIITDNPKWLQEKKDNETYLRGKVLINIYSKSNVIIEDATAGVHISFVEKKEELDGE